MLPMIRRNLLIGGCVIAMGILLIFIHNAMPQPQEIVMLSSIAISVGLLFIIISIFQQQVIDEKSVIADERILKIRAYTFMKAFSFSFTIVCILGILDFTRILIMEAQSVILITVFTMGLSSSRLSWYYNRKGDIGEI